MIEIQKFTPNGDFVYHGLFQRIAYVDLSDYHLQLLYTNRLLELLKSIQIESESISLSTHYSNYYRNYHQLHDVVQTWKNLAMIAPSKAKKITIKKNLPSLEKALQQAKYCLRFNNVLILKARKYSTLQSTLKLLKNVPQIKVMNRNEQIGFLKNADGLIF